MQQWMAVVQALLHLSQCLVALHSSGYVHRDVKPGAVLWLPSEHRWALVNFCRAARVGGVHASPCSLAYAAPEVAANASCAADGGVHAGAAPLPASPAADAWSLGIVALELFSRARALDVHNSGVETVCIPSSLLPSTADVLFIAALMRTDKHLKQPNTLQHSCSCQ
jgi:serine/threonine protein kinase